MISVWVGGGGNEGEMGELGAPDMTSGVQEQSLGKGGDI